MASSGMDRKPTAARGWLPPGTTTSGRPSASAKAARPPPDDTHTGTQPRERACAAQASASSVSPE